MGMTLADRVAAIEHRMANLNPMGQVAERDHEKGIRVRLGGTDKKPMLSDWIQPGDRSGASRYLYDIGDQVMVLSHGGDWSQATVLPLTHSDAKKNPAADKDETVHHNRDGQRSSVKKGHVKNQADKKHSKFVGEEPKGGSSGSPKHELNKQLQGIKAHLTQHDNNIAGLHDATSKMREIAEKVIPGLMALKPLLNSDPQSLEKAAQGIVGKLEGYVAKTMQGMIGKLTNGFMDNAMALVSGFMGDQLGGILDQVEALASGEGIEAALSGAMQSAVSEARGMVEGAVGGSLGPLTAHLDTMAGIAAGTPLEGAFADLKGQLTGALGAIGPIAAGIGDLVDNQKNLTKGLTKHYRLGGYDGEE